MASKREVSETPADAEAPPAKRAREEPATQESPESDVHAHLLETAQRSIHRADAASANAERRVDEAIQTMQDSVDDLAVATGMPRATGGQGLAQFLAAQAGAGTEDAAQSTRVAMTLADLADAALESAVEDLHDAGSPDAVFQAKLREIMAALVTAKKALRTAARVFVNLGISSE